MPSVQPIEMDVSVEIELTRARQKKPATREQIRKQVNRARSNSRGRLTQARRAGHTAHLDANKATPIHPRAESVGFVDTPKGTGHATALSSPRRFSDLGAVGGDIADLALLPPLTQQEGEAAETIDQYYAIGVGEPNDASTHDNNAASTSSSIDQEFVTVDPVVGTQGELPPRDSQEPFNLEFMETVQLRRIETMTEESIVSRMSRFEAHVSKCRSWGISCEKWANSHEAKLKWAKARTERDELRAKIEELNNALTELTARLD